MNILCAQTDGLETNILMVESCITRGFAGVQLIGNATEICKNGLERAKNALEGLGIAIPNKKKVIKKKSKNNFLYFAFWKKKFWKTQIFYFFLKKFSDIL